MKHPAGQLPAHRHASARTKPAPTLITDFRNRPPAATAYNPPRTSPPNRHVEQTNQPLSRPPDHACDAAAHHGEPR